MTAASRSPRASPATRASFVRMMNDRARGLGLTKSTFANVDGLPDPKMRVTRARACDASRGTSSTPIPNTTNGSASASSPGTRSGSRTAIRCSASSMGADGMKTGFTKEAGYSLVGSATRNGCAWSS